MPKNIKRHTLRSLYFMYSLYPVYIFVNMVLYYGRNISLKSFVFTRKIGKGVKIFGSVFIDNTSEIGNYTYISGDNFGLNNTRIENCTIGNYCSIARNLVIAPYSHDYTLLSTYPFKNLRGTGTDVIEKRVVIGNDVWIGNNVIIVGGVTVGSGSVIAAGSIVTKNVPENSIVAGVPAKFIKKRMSDKEWEEIKELNWWEKDIKEAYDIFIAYEKK